MAETIGLALLNAVGFGAAASTTILGVSTATIVGTTALTAASLTASALTARRPTLGGGIGTTGSGQSSAAAQQTIRQAIAARRRSYGRVKQGGVIVFSEVKAGFLYVQMAIDGEINLVEEYWINDKQAQINAQGFVFYPGHYVTGAVPKLQLTTQLGSPSQAAAPILVAAFPGVITAAHRMAGVANTLMVAQAVGADQWQTVYPDGVPTIRQIYQGARLFDPRRAEQRVDVPSTWTWTDNPGLAILDYLTHADGMRLPHAACALDAFGIFAAICDEQEALAAGGTENRFRLWGSYELTEEPRAVLDRMLRTCDGEVFQRSDGRIAIRGGRWPVPTVRLGPDIITGYALDQGPSAIERINVVRPTFTSPNHDYQDTQAFEWIDAASLAETGVRIVDELDVRMCPSPSQARRLAKLRWYKANPEWKGEIVTTLAGIEAFDEAVVLVTIPELGLLDHPMQVVAGPEISGDLTAVTLSVASLPPEAYRWNAAAEEGQNPAIPPSTAPPDVLQAPQGLAVAIADRGGVLTAVVMWTASSPAHQHEVRWRRAGVGAAWSVIPVVAGQTRVETPALGSGLAYETEVLAIAPSGARSAWSAAVAFTATSDAVAPAQPSGFSVVAGAGQITAAWTNPTSVNLDSVVIYAGATTDFAAATLVEATYGARGAAMSRTFAQPSGLRRVWLVANNYSGVGATPLGPQSATVT